MIRCATYLLFLLVDKVYDTSSPYLIKEAQENPVCLGERRQMFSRRRRPEKAARRLQSDKMCLPQEPSSGPPIRRFFLNSRLAAGLLSKRTAEYRPERHGSNERPSLRDWELRLIQSLLSRLRRVDVLASPFFEYIRAATPKVWGPYPARHGRAEPHVHPKSRLPRLPEKGSAQISQTKHAYHPT